MLSWADFKALIRAVQSIASDFQYRFLINIRTFPVIHGPSMLFHLTLITLFSDRWFCSSCVEGFYPTAAPKNENENIICSWINLARSPYVSFSIFKKVFQHCLNHLSRVMICYQVCHQIYRGFLGAQTYYEDYCSDKFTIFFYLPFAWYLHVEHFNVLIAFLYTVWPHTHTLSFKTKAMPVLTWHHNVGLWGIPLPAPVWQ